MSASWCSRSATAKTRPGWCATSHWRRAGPARNGRGAGARMAGRTTCRRLPSEDAMNLIRLYGRVLEQLGPAARLAWLLAIANVALATAQFAEPILFGRVVDTLPSTRDAGNASAWPHLLMLLLIWAGFGVFTIVCSTLVALYADRL